MIKKKLKVSVHLQNLNQMSSQSYHHKNKSNWELFEKLFAYQKFGQKMVSLLDPNQVDSLSWLCTEL